MIDYRSMPDRLERVYIGDNTFVKINTETDFEELISNMQLGCVPKYPGHGVYLLTSCELTSGMYWGSYRVLDKNELQKLKGLFKL